MKLQLLPSACLSADDARIVIMFLARSRCYRFISYVLWTFFISNLYSAAQKIAAQTARLTLLAGRRRQEETAAEAEEGCQEGTAAEAEESSQKEMEAEAEEEWQEGTAAEAEAVIDVINDDVHLILFSHNL